jgi:TctA family transporter
MVLAGVGASLVRGHWQDMVLVGFTGFMGYGMKKWGYPRPPMVLGFILGPLAEDYLHKSLAEWGLPFLLRPLCFALLILTVLSLIYSIYHAYREKKKKLMEGE